MSQAKYTPGPLRVKRSTNGTGDAGVLDATGCVVAEAFAAIRRHDERAEEEAFANATLYAAAPELLKVLRVARTYIQANRDSLADCHRCAVTGKLEPADVCALDDELLACIDTAIARAEGFA